MDAEYGSCSIPNLDSAFGLLKAFFLAIRN
jgi:hypothetical protein